VKGTSRASACTVLLLWAPIIFVTYTQSGVAAQSGKDLLFALNQGDIATAKRLIKLGAPVNATDDLGSSALMYAAMYTDLGTMRLLLEKGADPNHADQAGATALIWSIPDEDKVRLLIARGADVNATSRLTGGTALLNAAGHPGTTRIVKLMLDKGADAKVRDQVGFTPLLRASFNGDVETAKLLIDRGANVNASGLGMTPLFGAVNGNRAVLVHLLLEHGADATAKDQSGAGVLAYATSHADAAIFRELINRGADPKLRNSVGVDVMFMAAASDMSSPEMIKELVRLGADPKGRAVNLHVTHGYGSDPEGVVDWARQQGDTPVANLLAEMTGEAARIAPPVTRPLLRAASPREAIAAALLPLYKGSHEFFKRSGCASCHHNILPAIAFAEVRSKRIELEEEDVRQNYLQLTAWLNGNREGLLQDIPLAGAETTAAYLLWALNSAGHTRDRATDALVHHLAGSQQLDGGWQVRADRPPIESGRVTPTAIAIKALRAYPIPGHKAEFDRQIRRASKWLADYNPRTGEEKAMRLLGLVWAGADARLVRAAATKLAAEQRVDGGWAQLDSLSSDAYATGQALYALHLAERLTPDSLKKGVRFLLDTQLMDGSWHVRSRAYPLQMNYFDTGFPHGRDQWISAAATSWACIGLALAVAPEQRQ
jgi:ankyrin repeat protein